MDTIKRFFSGFAAALKGEISAWAILLLIAGVILVIIQFL